MLASETKDIGKNGNLFNNFFYRHKKYGITVVSTARASISYSSLCGTRNERKKTYKIQ
jgi:hypothetical protein